MDLSDRQGFVRDSLPPSLKVVMEQAEPSYDKDS